MSFVERDIFLDFEGRLARRLQEKSVRSYGQIAAIHELYLEATVPGGKIGQLVEVEAAEETLLAEIVRCEGTKAVLLPYENHHGVAIGQKVTCLNKGPQIQCSEALLGRVVTGLGTPLDGKGEIAHGTAAEFRNLHREAPSPFQRAKIARALPLGVRALDGLLTMGEGQRMGLFAGAGVGKSSLLGQIVRRCDADVVVVCLVGERGREVREFVEDVLGEEGVARSVVLCATSDQVSMARSNCAYGAMAVSEYFRDGGKRVLLLMDSLTRFARAARDVALAAGEPIVRRGYPASVFTRLPLLLERAGAANHGSISALFTVLLEGEDMDDPIADEVRGIIDGHIILSRRLAQQGHWPAIDVSASLSRLMGRLVKGEQEKNASSLRRMLAIYEANEDLIMMGAYSEGSDASVDEAIARLPEIRSFLQQGSSEYSSFQETCARLASLMA